MPAGSCAALSSQLSLGPPSPFNRCWRGGLVGPANDPFAAISGSVGRGQDDFANECKPNAVAAIKATDYKTFTT
jgi:hypothetical protein